MAAFAPIPSASDRIATTVTNGVLKSARSESLRLRMADGVRDLRGCKPISGLRRSLQVDWTLLVMRELTPSGWASVRDGGRPTGISFTEPGEASDTGDTVGRKGNLTSNDNPRLGVRAHQFG